MSLYVFSVLFVGVTVLCVLLVLAFLISWFSWAEPLAFDIMRGAMVLSPVAMLIAVALS